MLELSINLDELAFITLALGTLAFATLAVLATDIRTSVSGFLFAGLFVCTIAFCELPAEQSVVAVTLGITYLSISSLLLIMRKACCGSNTVEAKEKKLLRFW
ncbi:MAG: hypothetical protein IJT08_03105 [Alphaproteobacteria bacterium]|nr:hypothetical protein [Alphaproteobacteria bacterium]